MCSAFELPSLRDILVQVGSDARGDADGGGGALGHIRMTSGRGGAQTFRQPGASIFKGAYHADGAIKRGQWVYGKAQALAMVMKGAASRNRAFTQFGSTLQPIIIIIIALASPPRFKI